MASPTDHLVSVIVTKTNFIRTPTGTSSSFSVDRVFFGDSSEVRLVREAADVYILKQQDIARKLGVQDWVDFKLSYGTGGFCGGDHQNEEVTAFSNRYYRSELSEALDESPATEPKSVSKEPAPNWEDYCQAGSRGMTPEETWKAYPLSYEAFKGILAKVRSATIEECAQVAHGSAFSSILQDRIRSLKRTVG